MPQRNLRRYWAGKKETENKEDLEIKTKTAVIKVSREALEGHGEKTCGKGTGRHRGDADTRQGFQKGREREGGRSSRRNWQREDRRDADECRQKQKSTQPGALAEREKPTPR